MVDWACVTSVRRPALLDGSAMSQFQLYKTFTPQQYAEGLESWQWLDIAGKTPVFTSPFGSVFFESPHGVWFLDVVDGTLTHAWAGRAEAEAALATADVQQQYLMAGLAWAAHQQGMTLGPSQVYDLSHPPALGGSLTPDNLEPTDFVVSLNIAGQLHHQIKDLPPGAEVQIHVEE
jgi:hypothetical protein